MENIQLNDNTRERLEVINILKAIDYVDKNYHQGIDITKKTILSLHRLTMINISGSAGSFRSHQSAIFDKAGNPIYMPPSPLRISALIDSLLSYINSNTEKFPLISAFIAHLVFEKIHPFLDGNGRVGRLLIFCILKIKGYDFGMFVPFEEYLNDHKAQYYYNLDIGFKDAENYLAYMLEAFYKQTEKIRKEIETEIGKRNSIILPPRQEEIMLIIKDHRIVSFDFLRRRFMKIPKRTLDYDLKKLQEKNLVIKIGKTKGSYYSAKS